LVAHLDPDDPTWFNEVSFWTSKEALQDWHMTIYHKHAKAWAAQGAIMEDIITNFELKSTRLLRVCPCCGLVQDKTFDLHREQEVLAEPCPTCQFNLPGYAGDNQQHRGVQGRCRDPRGGQGGCRVEGGHANWLG
jgi:hypothetical protein